MWSEVDQQQFIRTKKDIEKEGGFHVSVESNLTSFLFWITTPRDWLKKTRASFSSKQTEDQNH